MQYFALGLILLVIVLFAARAFVNANPARLAQGVRYTGAGLLGAGAAYLFLGGRIGPAMLLGAGSLWLLGKWPWGIPGFGPVGGRAAGGGQSSVVETEFLRMTLAHESGELSGVVLRGRFRGAPLERLTLPELLDLLGECRIEDPQGASLLENYLDRLHPDWRGGDKAGAAGAAAPPPPSGMTEAEAREILGVGPAATAEEIRDAHRKLMKKLHPDQGGSTYLASKINQAKELLLGD